MLNLSMLRRLVALLFIFVLAGHVWAGVCGCLDNAPGAKRVSCCKKKKLKSAAVKAKSCCTAMCGARSGSRAPAETGVKISAPVLAAVEKLIVSLGWWPSFARRHSIPPPAARARAPLFAPPDLYLQNHAFLI